MSSTYRKVFLSSAVLAVLLLAGCSMKNPHRPGTFERGALYFENGKHYEATEALGVFLRRSPTDSMAALAQLMKAKSYMALHEYPLAAVELRIMQQDYPTSEHVVEACFLEGISYLRQVHNAETDIGGAVEAREHFLRFVETYPGSEYQEEIFKHLQDISDLVVRKSLASIHVYRQRNRHKAVAIVLDDALEREPFSRLIPELLIERARTARKLDEDEMARKFLQRLLREYPDNDLVDSARQALAKLPPEIPPDGPES